MKKSKSPKVQAQNYYMAMESCLGSIRRVAEDNGFADLEQTCIMFETDMKELEAAVNQARDSNPAEQRFP